MDVKVIGPIKEYLKTFSNPDEFNLWYAKNKDEIDNITTHKLNKMYYIDGYRITKIKGVLCLKKDIRKHSNDVNDNDTQIEHDNMINETVIDNIHNEIEQIKADILAIKTTVNDIVKAINGE